ncbi:MAG: type I glyceraldehyde-3-phosphate dehydrogenase [DPANN group archaeon]|nr:type I glyceraldehyde-3-phosphate dehydrogenase [DPANN group archaeon]
MVNVAINGFGRIGRLVFRAGFDDEELTFVAVNDLTDPRTLAHLLTHDTVHGRWDKKVSFTDDALIVDGKRVQIFAERDPSKLPWKDLQVDVVVESTGRFRDREGASKHLAAGARKVLISAPAKDPDLTLVKGVNEGEYDPLKHHIISNASCTTNCLAPLVKVLHDNFTVRRGFLTTVHAMTNDQNLLDLPHKDLRRARAAPSNIVPTTTGAAKAVALVLPELQGRLDGYALRVPVLDGSIIDFVAELEKPADADALNRLFRSVAEHELRGVISYADEPLVSSDIIGDPHSCIIDSRETRSQGTLVKVVAWYDNEWGYSSRMVDMIKHLMK